tara:strand:- start:3675 stop:4457 length:783 start_codon:yes stop_codon:yes gene_type:complete
MAYIGNRPASQALTAADIADGIVTNAKLAGSISNDKLLTIQNAALQNDSVTYNSVTVALGSSGSITTTETGPAFTSISPSVIDNTASSITITGTGFVSIPLVEAVNTTSGARITASSVAFTSATSLTATFTISIDGTYSIFIQNPDGEAISSGSVLTVSDGPAWSTGAGTLGTFSAASSISSTVTATGDAPITYSKTSGTFPGGLSLNTSTGVISGTESGATSTTQYSFTIRATDAESQTADRAFTMTITVGAEGSTQFN